MDEKKFLEFVAGVFEVDPEELSMETEYGVEPAWTSLMHLILISSIYEEFGVDIPVDEVRTIKTLADFYKYLK